MNLIALDKLPIEIDLSFDGFMDNTLLDINDAKIREILTEPEVWSENFSKWLLRIKSDNSFDYLEIIRNRRCFSLGLKFTDDHNISLLNKKWRNNNSSTDVLSFSAIEENIMNIPTEFLELGDIIVSIPTAFHQAEKYGHSLSSELQWLVMHGFLHLLGWDHPTEQSLNEMLALQEELLNDSGDFENQFSIRKETV